MAPIYRFFIANDSSDILKDATITYDKALTLSGSGLLATLNFIDKPGYFIADMLSLVGLGDKLVFPKRGFTECGYVRRAAANLAALSTLKAINGYSLDFGNSGIYTSFYISGLGTRDNLPTAYKARQCYPIYDDKLAMKYSKEGDYKFFRKSLDGKLRFVKDDYDYIMSSSLGSYQCIIIEKSNDDGKTWSVYFEGYFSRTDCSINSIDKIIETKLSTLDLYDEVIAGLQNEYNLITLAPETTPVRVTKEPILQIYSPGESVVSSYSPGGVYWEQECEAISDTNVLNNEHGFYSCGTVQEKQFWARIIHDNIDLTITRVNIKNKTQFGDFHNYRYATPYNLSGQIEIWASDVISSEPTEYGQRQPGEYYKYPQIPASSGLGPWFPISKTTWGTYSFWLSDPYTLDILSQQLLTKLTIKHAYSLAACINTILKKIAPNITHKAEEAYSKFFYSRYNPLNNDSYQLYITPITNVLEGGYDYPAQKMPIKLSDILSMLSNCFQVYWFIEDNKFRLEHITYFENGYSYDEVPKIAVDTTALIHPRSRKPWAALENEFEYDVDDVPARYEFGWADDSSKPFEGYPLEIHANYIKKDKVQSVKVGKFSTDIPLMLANPENFNKDNIAMIAADRAYDPVTISIQYPTATKLPAYSSLSENGDIEARYLVRPAAFQSNADVRINLTSMYDAQINIASLSASGVVKTIASDVMLTANRPYTLQAILPAGTRFLQINLLSGQFYAYIDTDTVQALGYPASLNRRITVKEKYDTVQYTLQNGHLAFADLVPKYYTQKLPSLDVTINNESLAELIWSYQWPIPEDLQPGKFKTQKISIPAGPDDFDISNLIRTSLGNGTIDEMKINMSSRLAEITLRHDLEPRNNTDDE